MPILSAFSTHLRPHWRLWTATAAARILFRMLPLQVPVVAGGLVDALSQQRPPAPGYGWALVLIAGLTGVTAFLSLQGMRELKDRVNQSLRLAVWQSWQRATPEFRFRYGFSRYLAQPYRWAKVPGSIFGETSVEGIAAIGRLLYPAGMLLWLSPGLALVPLFILPLQLLLTKLATRQEECELQAERDARRHWKRLQRESLAGVESVQAFGALAQVEDWIAAAREEWLQRKSPRGHLGRLLASAAWGFTALGLGLSWWAGAWQVSQGHMSTGELVSFTAFAGLLGLPVRRLGQVSREVASALDQAPQLAAFLKEAQAASLPGLDTVAAPAAQPLQLQAVQYRLGSLVVLDNVTQDFPAHELIWLRGRSGVGKSALLRLLAGIDSPQAGLVRRPAEVLLVPKATLIISASLLANLTFGNPHVTEEQVCQACRAAGLEDWLNTLPEGLATPLGEEGLPLANGIRQRISLVRAWLRQPAVLLLDEPTASLDEEGEYTLFQFLAKAKQSATVVVVAPQVRSYQHIDRVLDLRDGRLNEFLPQQLPHLITRSAS